MYTAEASVFVDADQQTAWEYVSNYQNFDQFMPNVKEVKTFGVDASEWHLSGPLGIPVSWKAVTTINQAPSHLAWHSTEGNIKTKGFIKLEPASPTTGEIVTSDRPTIGMANTGGSRITVHMEYEPPLGALGEAFASLFKDPQHMLEAGLEKLASLLSSGNPKALNKQESRQVDAEIGLTDPVNTVSSRDPDWDVNRDRRADGSFDSDTDVERERLRTESAQGVMDRNRMS
jgi:uncharacterized membrane protein